MKTRQTKSKNKKNKRRNIDLVMFRLRALKILKIVFNIVVFVSTIFMLKILFQSDIPKKIKEKLSQNYSKIVLKDICVSLEINGIERADMYKLQKKIHDFCEQDNKNDMQKLLNEITDDPWIKEVSIKRKLPNTLSIKIEEYLPFAIWKSGEKLHLIDETGKIIRIQEKERRGYYNLLVVAGEGSKENIYGLFNLLSSNPALFSKIKSGLRIGKRRWNLELDSGVIVKMPEKDVIDAWYKLDKLISIPGSEINLRIIDLRNEDKVFLEEK